MANKKEVKQHIDSVSDIKLITNVMYLIASTKLRRAKEDLKNARGCFTALDTFMNRLAGDKRTANNPYFTTAPVRKRGIVVITADKGLAGAYNYNVIRKTLGLITETPEAELYVMGAYGKRFFTKHKLNVVEDFTCSPEGGTLHKARQIGELLFERYKAGDLTEIYVVYSDFSGGMSTEVKVKKLLPIESEEQTEEEYEFFPSLKEAMDGIVPEYLTGYMYGAITDAFCSEQNSRMTAMDAANRNAEKIMDELSVKYDHIRQNSITQEIIEVSAGVNRQRQKETEK